MPTSPTGSTTLISRRPAALVLVALALALLVTAVWSFRPAESAPGATGAMTTPPRLGTVTYATLGGSNVTVDITSWRWQGALVSDAGTGGGSGKVDFGDPTFAQGVGAKSPLLTLQLATGKHFTSVTVVLFRNGTTTRAQQFVLTGASLTGITQARSSASAKPVATVSVDFGKVTETTYAANGTTEVARSCFNLATSTAC